MIPKTPDAEIQPLQLGHEKRSSRAGQGRYLGNSPVVVDIVLADNRDEAFAAGNVNALVRRVVPHVVGMADAGNAGEHLS